MNRDFFRGVVSNPKMLYNGEMRMARAIILTATLAVGAVLAEEAKPLDNYRSIIDRNPFGLKPPPPPVEVKPAEAPPPVEKKTEFYLTGISSIGFPKQPMRAYLLNKDNSKKDYDEKFYTLVVGEKHGDVSLKEIDRKGRKVKIAYRGEDIWLSMKDNAPPTPAGGPPAVAGVPGATAAMAGPPGSIPLPGGVQHTAAMPAPVATGANANPNRRTPRTMGGMNNGMNGGYNPGYVNPPNGGFMNGAQGLPANSGANPVQTPPQQEIDTAAQYFNMKMQEAAEQKLGNPTPPIPPPPL